MTQELVGSDILQYRVVPDWDQLPDGWSHPDVPGVAVDSEDRVFLFTRTEHPVMVFDGEGGLIETWGSNDFVKPHHITITEDDHIFCVDKDSHVVHKYSLDGTRVLTIGHEGEASNTGYEAPDYLTVQRAAGPFNQPTKAAIAADGSIFVADGYGNTRVHRFSPDGEHLFSWGSPGTGIGEFHIPHSIAIDSDDRILVADRENARIQIFDLEGKFLEQWTEMARPDDLAVGRDGRVYIAELGRYAGRYAATPPDSSDALPSNVSVWDPDGYLVARWGGREYCSPGSFFAPHGIAVDSKGNIFVTEANWSGGGKDGKIPPDCHTVQKFEPV